MTERRSGDDLSSQFFSLLDERRFRTEALELACQFD
jgi:hypothetical protein